jgi:hypothetical protein
MVEDLGRDGAADLTADAVEYGLPCGSCYVGERDARSLPGLRLGKHERRILLATQPPTDGAAYEIIYPDGPSRAAEEANRRALKKLEAAGLVQLSQHYPSWQRLSIAKVGQKEPEWFQAKQNRSRYNHMGRRYRSAMLTPLGGLVVERCRDELEGGKPIRWAKRIDGLARDVRQPMSELFRQFSLWIGGAVRWSGYSAMFARTQENRERANQRRESAKRFQAFVSEKAARPEGAL